MASILNRGGLAFALIVLIVVSSSIKTTTVADARNPHSLARQLARDCDHPGQSDIPGCPGSGGSSRSGRPSGPAPGSSKCPKGCCGNNKWGDCICCK
ncbi:hypothetical protein CTI12_AA023840 [Artemisia annua]|uniref:Uncharacterized protein n=1 Tax=Artemisia annua TaxID=35608 RepID=A0A2U1QJ63_ARTAN|nr:hypothetical protein CTI12_AA023840 [Artemisia annua]